MVCTLLLLLLPLAVSVTPFRPAGAAVEEPGGVKSPPASCRPTIALVRRTLVVGGLARSYLVSVPAGLRRPAPVLLAFHGYSSSGSTLALRSRLHDAAGARGFVTVFPEGTGSPTRWALPRRIAGPDDGAFVDALVRDVARRACGDARAVFAAGFSNGAAFVGHLACRRPNAYRGLALVAGAGLALPCAAERTDASVPIVMVHGRADRVVALAGGPVLGGALQAEPLATAAARWRRATGRAVTVRVVPKVGHVWPPLATQEIVATFAG